jgi:dTDP-4-dehydrorhamnose reductase
MSSAEPIKVIVTGSKGQLGNEIASLVSSYKIFQFTLIDLDDLDLGDSDAVRAYFNTNRFDAIINCAAYTAVDLAEDNRELAFKVNSESVRVLAQIAREQKMRFIHISTDYVFDGESGSPINESAIPSPLSVYGHSKLEGEKHLQEILPDSHYIIRTAWVYSPYGKNFVKTMKALGAQREEISVVADQIGSPTYANDLAMAILSILSSVFAKNEDKPGIYHYSNEGVLSWYDLAHFVIRYYNLPCRVKPIRTEEYPTKATRPKFSLLDKRKIKESFGVEAPHWHDSLVRCLEKMR